MPRELSAKTRILLLASSITLLHSLSGVAQVPAKPARPNLLVITFDTTRADRLGAYGYEKAQTPNIDRLAREGVLFLNAHAQSPQTLPSHASLFTGHYTITHNVRSNGQHLEENAITLAEVLRTEGYQTGAIVATAALLSGFNLDQGFETYNDNFEEPIVGKAFKNFFRFFSRRKVNLYSTRPANRVTALARKWLKKAASKKKPFFLWIHYFDPHAPYLFHPDFDRPGRYRRTGSRNAYGELEENYVNEIGFADHHMGRVLKQLDKLDLSSNTLVLLTADHGESLGEHGYTGHRKEVYEQIIRIPMIFRLPGKLPAGGRLGTPAMSIDVAPTILTLLGISYPENAFAGKDLFALDPREPRKRFSLAVKLFTKDPIRTALFYRNHKFIQFDKSKNNLLFDLSKDRAEKSNLFDPSNHTLGIDWAEEVSQWFAQFERLSVNDFKMSREQMEKLRSLGYVGN